MSQGIRRVYIKQLSIAAVFSVMLSASLVYAEKIGYDENTEVVVKGVVQNEAKTPYKGYSNFFLKTNWKIYRVLTAPNWYLKRNSLKFQKGQKVKVVGSKFYGPDGSLCIVAKSVHLFPQGKIIRFRDTLSRPIWSEEFGKKNSCMKIFFSGTKAY